jgi:hypothetical protein
MALTAQLLSKHGFSIMMQPSLVRDHATSRREAFSSSRSISPGAERSTSKLCDPMLIQPVTAVAPKTTTRIKLTYNNI